MSFDVAADAYDRFMGGWSRLLAAPFADLAGVRAGRRVLDVGCGPGALTGELVARVGTACVAAVDPSAPFVEAARQRLPGVDVRQAPAERLPFEDATFDAVLAQLVVHFMADPVAGLAEMARVSRPDGTVAACVWDYAEDHGPLGPFWTVARELDPAAADESGLPGAARGDLAALLARAGLAAVEEAELWVRRDYAGFDDWWEPYTRGVGPAGGFVAKLQPAVRDELRDRCRARLPAGPFTLEARAWAARGRAA